MNNNQSVEAELQRAGIGEEALAQFKRYRAEGNPGAQLRVIMRSRQACKQKLCGKRDQLACVDYLISQLEKSQADTGSGAK